MGINKKPDSITPIKKQWQCPEIFLIARNDVETKHLPYIREGTGHFGTGPHAGTFFSKNGLSSTLGGGLRHNSLVS